MIYSATTFYWTWDESTHLGWSERLVATGNYERASRWDFNSKSPIHQLNVYFSQVVHYFFPDTGYLVAARAANILWYIILVGGSLWVASMLGGMYAGLLAATLTALNPVVIPHSALITTDAPFAASFLMLLGAQILYLRKPGTPAALLIGIFLGFAITSKVMGLMCLVLSPCCFLATFVVHRRSERLRLRSMFCHFALSYSMLLFITGGFFHFAGMTSPLGKINFKFEPFRILQEWAYLLPAIFPEGLWTMWDRCFATNDAYSQVIWRYMKLPTPVPSYLPVVVFFKVTLITSCVWLIGAMRLAWLWKRERSWELYWTLLVGGAFLFYFCFFFHALRGVRFFLMLLPLFNVLAACGIAYKDEVAVYDKNKEGSWRIPLVCAGVLFFSVVEFWPYRDDLYPFSNSFIRDKREAAYFLNNNNLNWRQQRDRVKIYRRQQGIKASHENPVHPLTGKNLIHICRSRWNNRFDRYHWLFKHHEPDNFLHNFYLQYNLTHSEFLQYIDSHRTLQSEEISTLNCQQQVRASAGQLVQITASRPRRSICFASDADLLMRVVYKTARVSSSKPHVTVISEQLEGVESTVYVRPKREVWFGLKRGGHLIDFGSRRPVQLSVSFHDRRQPGDVKE